MKNDSCPLTITPVSTKDPEPIALHQQIKRKYPILSADIEIDKNMILSLKAFTEHKPKEAIPQITINDVQETLSDMLNPDRLVKDRLLHVPSNKPTIYLRKFVHSHEIDYVRDSFKEGIQFAPEEFNSNLPMYKLWFMKCLGATRTKL